MGLHAPSSYSHRALVAARRGLGAVGGQRNRGPAIMLPEAVAVFDLKNSDC